MSILIGTDPEVFLKGPSGFISAHDLIPGSKQDPHPVPFGALQPDGVSAEFNITPAATREEFLHNISSVMESLKEAYSKINPGLTVAIQPTATFDKEYFFSLPDEALALGCSPDFNAYTQGPNEPPSTNEPFRTGAGHIHIGFTKDCYDGSNWADCVGLTKQLDCCLYLNSLLWDSDNKRRTLYGKLGAFRPKPYGVEYRPLSNAYLRDEKTRGYVFDVTKIATELYFSGTLLFEDPMIDSVVQSIRGGASLSYLDIKGICSYIEEVYGVPSYE